MNKDSATPSSSIDETFAGALAGTDSQMADDTQPARPAGESAETTSKITSKERVLDVIEYFQDVLSGSINPRGIPTGFANLDEMTGGLRPGNVFVIASRPSMGKTSLMLNILEHVCVGQKIPSLVFSGDLTASEITQRLIFNRACSPLRYDTDHDYMPFTKGELQRIEKAALEVARANLFVDEARGLAIEDLREKARQSMSTDMIRFIAIDDLHLLRSICPQAKPSRKREVTEVFSAIKGLARELDIPILVLAQLKRRAETRVPRITDIRESGVIEHEADLIGLLHRRDQVSESDKAGQTYDSRFELLLAKNRHGTTGALDLAFWSDIQFFWPIPSEDEQIREAWDDHIFGKDPEESGFD